MRLLDLSIVRMPGIERRIRIQSLDETFNIILGANASGKSSMCRAAQALLWPDAIPKDSYWEVLSQWSPDTPGTSSKGEVAEHAAQIEIAIRGQEHRVLQYGSLRDPVRVPSEALRACYLITLEDLFVSDGSDLAAMMANEMAGGFDIHAVKDKPPVQKKRVHNELKQLKQAQQNLRKIDAQQKSLKQKEIQLEQLREQLCILDARASEKDCIKDAIDLRRLRREEDERRQELYSFPKGLENLYGNELTDLDELQQERERLEQKALESSRKVDAANELIEAQSLPKQGVSESEMEVLRALIQQLSPIDADAKQLKAKIRKCEQALSLGPLSDSGDLLTGLDHRSETLQKLSASAHALEGASSLEEKLARECSLLERRLDQNPLGDYSSGDYSQASRLLHELIEQHLALIRNKTTMTSVVSLILLCALSLAAGYFLNPILYGLTVLGPISFLPIWLTSRASRKNVARLEDECVRHPLLRNVAIQESEALSSLRKAAQLLDTEREKIVKNEERRRDDEQYYQVLQYERAEAKEEKSAILCECSAILEELGVQTDIHTFSISSLSRELETRAKLVEDLREATSSYRARRSELRETLERISAFLERFGYATCKTTEEAQAHTIALQKRRELQRKAVEQRSNAIAGKKETERLLERLSTKYEELYQRANIPSEARSELEARVGMLQAYKDTKRKEAETRGTIAHLSAKLRSEAPELLERSLVDLERDANEADTALREYHELRDQIVGIQNDISSTRSERLLEETAETVRASEEQLRETALENARSELCSLLLDEIQTEHLQKNRPEVFSRSSELFSRFTHGRYSLSDITPEKHGAAFRVFDSHQGMSLELSQLSSGTKAQILLACKVAFAQSAERGDPIPLFFDEALSTSDPLRFQAVIEALCTLARDGRQILYFTSQPKDTQAISALCEQQSCSVALHTISRDMEISDAPLLTSSPAFNPVPKPDGLSYEEYVRSLNVEPLSLSKGSSAIHLAHLTDDKDLLHSLLEMHIETFGQLKTLYEGTSASTYISEAAYRCIAARHHLISSSFEQWKIGRGEPLTPEIIQEALPKTKHRDNILDIWRETRDTIRFLDAIDPNKGKAVSRFKVSQFEQLREALVERGNFSETPPLSEAEFHRNVLNEVAAEVETGALSKTEAARMSRALWEQLSNAMLY